MADNDQKKTWKLSSEQKRLVVERYRKGEPVKCMAYDYSISKSAVVQLAHDYGEPLRRIQIHNKGATGS